MQHNERSSFFFGLTLTEIIILLFFIVLLLSVMAIQTLEEEKKSMEEQLSRAQSELDESFKKLVNFESIVSILQDESPEALEREFERLVKAEKATNSLKEERDAALAENERLLEKNRHLEGLAAEATDQKESLEGQNKYLVKQLNKSTGFGLPPCWADSRGKVEYLFTITLRKDAYEVQAAWPQSRTAQAMALPSVNEMVDESLPRDHFMRLSKPIYDWSENQECRHYVKIVDTDEIDKATFKWMEQKTVEQYFYKYRVN